MKTIDDTLKQIKKAYDRGDRPLEAITVLVTLALRSIEGETWKEIGITEGRAYSILVSPNGHKSRPVLRRLFETSSAEFTRRWLELTKALDGKQHRIALPADEINSVLYTAVMSVAVSFDLWRPKSRKTPGTFFEILLGSVIGTLLPAYHRTKHISLDFDADEEGSGESVSTDIVFSSPDGIKSLVIPAKITTRERIVQPFAHQRILDSKFGEGRFVSLLMCVSETQRDEKTNTAKMICVPGTIQLFQQHLARLGGIFYLDPPARYLKADLQKLIPIESIGEFLSSHLPTVL